jgi:hypothetical protein
LQNTLDYLSELVITTVFFLGVRNLAASWIISYIYGCNCMPWWLQSRYLACTQVTQSILTILPLPTTISLFHLFWCLEFFHMTFRSSFCCHFTVSRQSMSYLQESHLTCCCNAGCILMRHWFLLPATLHLFHYFHIGSSGWT